MSDEVDIARAWVAALNARDVDAMLALAAPDIEFSRPRATAIGHDFLREFIARQHYGVGLFVVVRRVFHRAGGDTVVADALNELRWVEGGELADEYDRVRTWVIRDGKVVISGVNDDLEEALAAAGLTEADLVSS